MLQEVRYDIDAERRKMDADRARRMNDAFKKSGPERPGTTLLYRHRKPESHADACRCGLCTGAKRPPLKSDAAWGDGKPKIAGFRRLAITPEMVLEWLDGLCGAWKPMGRPGRLALADDLEEAARVLRGEHE